MSEDAIQLTIGRTEALVLFDLLAEFSAQSCVQVESSAERLALLRLTGALQNVLLEPFFPDYKQLVHEARARLSAQAGA